MERERSMERSRTQLELDWQRRYEEKESNQYEKSEDLIKKLVKSRDEVISESRIKLVEFLCPAWSFYMYMYIIWVCAYFYGEKPCSDITNFILLIHQLVTCLIPTCYFTQNIENILYIEDYFSFVYKLNL